MSRRYRGHAPVPRGAVIGPTGAPPGPRDGGSFTDRVMARVAIEPTPSPGRVFARSARRLAVRDAVVALATAWRLATEPAAPVAASARASAAALFLSVVVIVGVGGAFVTSGVLGLLGPDDHAPVVAPAATPAITLEPTPSPQPTPSPTPVATPLVAAPTPTERETPEPTERKTEKPETPEPRERKTEKPETPEPKERERDEHEDEDDD